jgi:alkanesulfonate monooxygenase SsuD/methylene tetrahydromethanopterin reductase-like flavin-dependent oxidoreductase (luciferase family)
MKFGLLYELQLPRPWNDLSELNLFQNAIQEVAEADRLGYDSIWANEHHFLEEYAHSSAPEVFLAACAARTKNIRIGHAVTLSPPAYNHPARVAERIATLDLVSTGRVEWGTGESASRTEIEGFAINAEEKRSMWAEATEQTANMLVMNPYPGFSGKHFAMPRRNVVPKPLQKPHPPLWLACSKRETIHRAAQCGMGALTFAFVDPPEAGKWAEEYYDIIKSEQCVPIGHSVNANIACVTGFSVHEDPLEAVRRGAEGFKFFGYALGHYYIFGEHLPGQTNVWKRFKSAEANIPDAASNVGIGSPDQLLRGLREYQDKGIDQMILLQQSGNTSHGHIMESIRLFAAKVMPELKRGQAEREARKREELAPYIQAALRRKQQSSGLHANADGRIVAYGKSIAAGEFASQNEGGSLPPPAAGFSVPTTDPSQLTAEE